eukprot:symbB.v1.2.030264.t1/scaffold3391.1/size57876/5
MATQFARSLAICWAWMPRLKTCELGLRWDSLAFLQIWALKSFVNFVNLHDPGDQSQDSDTGYSFGRMQLCIQIINKATHASVQKVQRPIRPLKDLESVLGVPGSEQSATILCAICLDTAGEEGLRTLQCNHAYHLECIKAWCQQQAKDADIEGIECPLCRQHHIPVEPSGPDPQGIAQVRLTL